MWITCLRGAFYGSLSWKGIITLGKKMNGHHHAKSTKIAKLPRNCILPLVSSWSVYCAVSNAKKVKTRKSHSSCTTYFYNCSNNSKVQCGLECKNYSSIKPVLFMLLVLQQTQSKCVLKRWKIRCTRFACNLLCFCKLHGYLYENLGFFITRKTWFTRRLFAFGSQ